MVPHRGREDGGTTSSIASCLDLRVRNDRDKGQPSTANCCYGIQRLLGDNEACVTGLCSLVSVRRHSGWLRNTRRGISTRNLRLLRLLTDLMYHGSTSDTYGRWNIASQRGSRQPRTTSLRLALEGRHDDDDTEYDK